MEQTKTPVAPGADQESLPIYHEEQSKNKYLCLERIPEELKSLKQWVLWKFEHRKGAKKPTKVPYQPCGRKAQSNNRATWSSFATVSTAYERGGVDGIGFCFGPGDGLLGADLDHCFDRSGKLELWAKRIVDKFSPTYVERSPSRGGLHILCRGKAIKTGSKKWKKGANTDQGVEIYDCTSPRYFTVTGDVYSGEEIIDCPDQINWLYEEYFAEALEEPKQCRKPDGAVDHGLIQKALGYIPSDDYSLWIHVGMALKSAGLPVETWDEWSQRSAKFVPGECNHKWETFTRNRIGLGTLFYLAQKHGFRWPASGSNSGAEIVEPIEQQDWTNPETFGEPIFFGGLETPEINADFLPTWVRKYVEAVAEGTQTPVAMSAMLVLSILAACLQKRFQVSPYGDDYVEPLIIWILLALPPSTRKTSVMAALIEPLERWERKMANELGTDIERTNTEREIITKRIEELIKLASRAEN